MEYEGGKVNGPLELDGSPNSPNEAATKGYVDEGVAGATEPEVDVSGEVSGVTVRGSIGAVLVYWTGSDLVHGLGYYDVELSRSSSFSPIIQSEQAKGTFAVFGGLATGVTYHARVRGSRADGTKGPWSTSFDSPPEVEDGDITSLSADKITAGTITASIGIESPLITGGTVQTASFGPRVDLHSTEFARGLRFYGDGGALMGTIRTEIGTPGLLIFGDDNIYLQGEVEHSSNSYFANGSGLLPSISFASDPDTGIYRSATNKLSLTAGGSLGFSVESGGVRDFHNGSLINVNEVKTHDGSATDPSYTFTSDGGLGMYKWADGVLGFATKLQFTDEALFAMTGAVFRPDLNGVTSLGGSGFRWADVWCSDSTLNGSDAELKDDIVESELGLGFLDKLRPVSYRWKGKVRPHYGLIAQDVKSTMDELGVDFAGYADPTVTLGPEPQRSDFTDERNYAFALREWKASKGSGLALRYTEFIAPIIKGVQELHAKVQSQEDRIARLEAALLELQGG